VSDLPVLRTDTCEGCAFTPWKTECALGQGCLDKAVRVRSVAPELALYRRALDMATKPYWQEPKQFLVEARAALEREKEATDGTDSRGN